MRNHAPHRVAIIAMAAVIVAAASVTADDAKPIPDEAVCRACELRGETHGAEKVAASREYEGHTFYFCSQGCAEAFDQFPAAYVPPVLPRPAPQIRLRNLDGSTLDLRAMTGNVVLVDFWATWCSPCIKAMPELQKLHATWADSGFAVLGVSIDDKKTPAEIQEFAKKKKLKYAVAMEHPEDPAWQAFRVPAIPAMFLVDREMRIVDQWMGQIDMRKVAAAVERCIAAKPERAGG